jgi:hypothetical protein
MRNRSNCQTAMAAAFGTGAELSRRGYNVCFTVGNTPRIDLLCCVPDGDTFKVQVKGISNRAGFWVQQSFFDATAQNDLFLVIVLVPKEDDLPLRFFIMSHVDAKAESEKLPKFKRDGRRYEVSGLAWGSVTPHEGRWDKFPLRGLGPPDGETGNASGNVASESRFTDAIIVEIVKPMPK